MIRLDANQIRCSFFITSVERLNNCSSKQYAVHEFCLMVPARWNRVALLLLCGETAYLRHRHLTR